MRLYIFLLVLLPAFGKAQDPDRRAVHNAALDYLEGMYQADAARIRKSVHEDLVKQGFYWKGKSQEFSSLTRVSYEQLVQIARDWNRDQWLPDDAPRDIEILDIQEKIATVKVTAYWGVDYLQLIKEEGEWLIMQVLWQNWPKYRTSEGAMEDQ